MFLDKGVLAQSSKHQRCVCIDLASTILYINNILPLLSIFYECVRLYLVVIIETVAVLVPSYVCVIFTTVSVSGTFGHV